MAWPAIHKLFNFLPPLPCWLTTTAEEREQNKWERAAKHKAYGGTVAYMDKIPHQNEIRNFPRGKIPPRNSPPPCTPLPHGPHLLPPPSPPSSTPHPPTHPAGWHGGPVPPLAPLCDIPSGCCSFTGPWTVTRSSLRMLRRVAAFCRPLRPVLLLVSFPRSRSPVVGVPGLCWMWHGVPSACQRRPIVGVLRMCWLLPGSFDCFCCPHTSVHRPSIACPRTEGCRC